MTLNPEAKHTRRELNRKQRRTARKVDKQLTKFVAHNGDEPEMLEDDGDE